MDPKQDRFDDVLLAISVIADQALSALTTLAALGAAVSICTALQLAH
jgi:hypothetical protein